MRAFRTEVKPTYRDGHREPPRRKRRLSLGQPNDVCRSGCLGPSPSAARALISSWRIEATTMRHRWLRGLVGDSQQLTASAPKSISSRKRMLKASTVLAASYLRRWTTLGGHVT